MSRRNGKECLHMHNLLEQMGKNIVMQESPKDAGKRSRLWYQEKVDKVLKGNKGTENIQSIVLNSKEPYMADWHPDCFSNMCNLILLSLSNVHLLHSLNSLPSALKVLIWERYPLEALPHNINQLDELVELTLHHSKIKQLWNGTSLLGKLKFINLSYSGDLIQTPDFSGVPNLEHLFLEGCMNLVMVHESIGPLKKLVKLNLKDCKSLIILPGKLEMNSLQELLLSGCSKLEKLPEFGENMKHLSICDVSETSIREVPISIIHLTNLKELSLHGYKGPYSFSLSGLSSLRKLDLSFCNLWDESIPDDLRGLPSLIELDLRGNQFSDLPSDSISNLLKLQRLYLSGCARLQSLPKLSPNLIRIFASCCPSMKPLKDMQHLVASLVSKRRSDLLHEVIFLRIPGDEIPTWFEEQEHHVHYDVSRFQANTHIGVDMLGVSDKSEWWGIAVCLVLRKIKPSFFCILRDLRLGFRAPEEDKDHYYKHKQVKKSLFGNADSIPHLCIAIFPFNTLNCWPHVRGKRHAQPKLQMKIFGGLNIGNFGWRMISKNDFEGRKSSEGSIQITDLDNEN